VKVGAHDLKPAPLRASCRPFAHWCARKIFSNHESLEGGAVKFARLLARSVALSDGSELASLKPTNKAATGTLDGRDAARLIKRRGGLLLAMETAAGGLASDGSEGGVDWKLHKDRDEAQQKHFSMLLINKIAYFAKGGGKVYRIRADRLPWRYQKADEVVHKIVNAQLKRKKRLRDSFIYDVRACDSKHTLAFRSQTYCSEQL